LAAPSRQSCAAQRVDAILKRMATPKIYTKSGDKGQTSLVDGTRVPKSHLRLETYGTVDELNSFVGLLRSEITREDRLKDLKEIQYLWNIQNLLFNLGSRLACADPQMRDQLPGLGQSAIETIEKNIDHLTQSLTPLRNFILPGGSPPASLAHVCRSVCRRAERITYALHESEPQPEDILIYLNRLSDYFFTLARWLSLKTGSEDQLWSKDERGDI
jgi:cob(I)alamin adenosyltransferase